MYSRKVLRWTAEDSPNVRLGLAQARAGVEVTGETLVPGVLSYFDYLERRKWPKRQQLISLDALFPEDEGLLLFPPAWLKHSADLFNALKGRAKRQAKAMGIDPGEGGANTVWCVVDEYGVLDLVAKLTPNTNVIPSETVALGRRWQVPPERWCFDRGGGGKQHADRLRAMGLAAQTVGFNEAITVDLKRGLTLMEERRDHRETKYAYSNRRSEMYGTLSELMDPEYDRGGGLKGFALPPRDLSPAAERLHRQLGPIPISYDKHGEGTLCLPPKAEMIATLYNNEGSPDEADALVLAVYGLTHKVRRAVAGASC